MRPRAAQIFFNQEGSLTVIVLYHQHHHKLAEKCCVALSHRKTIFLSSMAMMRLGESAFEECMLPKTEAMD